MDAWFNTSTGEKRGVMDRQWKTPVMLLLATGLFFGGFPALYGQKEEAEKQAPVHQEMVVTLERRAENLLAVPVTMSVLTSDTIYELGIRNRDDLDLLIPGLRFGDEGGRIGRGPVIRGMGSRRWGEIHGIQDVAIYVDGVRQRSPMVTAANLLDIERVEIARGPQGTLHGSNAIGGAISFVTKGPPDKWEVEVLTEFTNGFSQRYNVAFGGPITDWFKFRIAGGYHDGDGTQENLGPGPDQDAPHEWNIRPKLQITGGRWDLGIRYEYAEETGLSRMQQMIAQPPTDRRALCYSWRAPDDPRALDPEDPLMICNETWNNGFYLDPVPVQSLAKCPGSIATGCDELQYKIYTNRPAQENRSWQSWAMDLDFELTETLSLQYTYARGELDQLRMRDGDMTGRIPDAEAPWLPADCANRYDAESCEARWEDLNENGIVDPDTEDLGAYYADSHIAYSQVLDEKSHELQVLTNFDGPLNFVAGLYYYEEHSDWRDDVRWFDKRWRSKDADAAARLLKYDGLAWDEDLEMETRSWSVDPNGGGEYEDCEQFLTSEEFQAWVDEPWSWSREAFSALGRSVTCASGTDHTSIYGSASTFDMTTRAAFLSLDYRLSDRWNLSAGLRYSRDQIKRPSDDDDYTEVFYGVPFLFDHHVRPERPEQDWPRIIWNAGIEYSQADRHLIYLRVSTGYRAGGFWQSSGSTMPFDEEKVVSYEIGSKGHYFDGRMMLTSAGFYNEYNGYQINGIMIHPYYVANKERWTTSLDEAGQEPEGTQGFLGWWPLEGFPQNVHGTVIWGGEVQLSWQLTENWHVGGFYAYLDSSLGRFQTIIQDDPDPVIERKPGMLTYWDEASQEQVIERTTWAFPVPKDFGDGTLPQQPKHEFALTAAYERPLGGLGSLRLLGTWSYTGERYSVVYKADSFKIPSYDRIDLRATWTPDAHWSVSLFIQNAFDETGFVEYREGVRPHWAYGATQAYPTGLLVRPREMGLLVHWKL